MKHFLVTGLLAAVLMMSAGVSAQAQNQRPNVLVVVVDDAGFMDFGAYGGEAATPAT